MLSTTKNLRNLFVLKQGRDINVLIIRIVRLHNNQNCATTQKRVAARLERAVKDSPDLKLAKGQKDFVSTVKKSGSYKLKAKKIDMAHNISADSFINHLLNIMNGVTAEDYSQADAEAFIDDFLSSGDEAGKVEAKDSLAVIADPSLDPASRVTHANNLIHRFNCASKNLIPGDASLNRSIGSARDVHAVLGSDGKATRLPYGRRLVRAYEKFGGICRPVPVTVSGVVKCKSSSAPGGVITASSATVSEISEISSDSEGKMDQLTTLINSGLKK